MSNKISPIITVDGNSILEFKRTRKIENLLNENNLKALVISVASSVEDLQERMEDLLSRKYVLEKIYEAIDLIDHLHHQLSHCSDLHLYLYLFEVEYFLCFFLNC